VNTKDACTVAAAVLPIPSADPVMNIHAMISYLPFKMCTACLILCNQVTTGNAPGRRTLDNRLADLICHSKRVRRNDEAMKNNCRQPKKFHKTSMLQQTVVHYKSIY
jgi:hypothetical protein